MPSGSRAKPPGVIKVGGAVQIGSEFWRQVAELSRRLHVVIVHGAGAQCTEMAERMGHNPRFVRGRRITGDLDLEIARWVTRGSVNLDLVSRAAQHGLRAVGISGVDGALLRLRRRPPWTVDGAVIDFGWVGDVLGACPDILDALHSAGFIPVVASLGADASGQVLNVNADTVAGAIAAATGARELLMVTPSGGLRRRVDEPDSLLSVCTARESSAGLAEGWIAGGMQVKLTVAMEAVAAGIETVLILGPEDLVPRRRATRIMP